MATYLTNDKLVIVGAAGMIGSNMVQTALTMRMTPNICLYDVYAPGLEGVAEEMFHCGFEGANITWTTDVKEAFTDFTKITKVRIANTVIHNVTSSDKDVNAHNGMMNTALGLLAKGDLNCAGQAITKTDLFSEPSPATTPVGDINKPRKFGETEPGVVMTAKEKEALEEERRRKLAEAQREADLREQELNQQRERDNEGKSFFNRIKKSGKDFISKLISEEPADDEK